MKLFLSVIIPVRNEVKRLPLTLVDIDKHLSKATFPYEIIVVDGASTDGTPELVEKFKELIANLKLIE
ncbi:MAG: glycosyltransferase, partial [Candidatus Colwellbacteria bacterium]|nr:glycosyltransferase [Candidatus Colwellbacteria bacterium]